VKLGLVGTLLCKVARASPSHGKMSFHPGNTGWCSCGAQALIVRFSQPLLSGVSRRCIHQTRGHQRCQLRRACTSQFERAPPQHTDTHGVSTRRTTTTTTTSRRKPTWDQKVATPRGGADLLNTGTARWWDAGDIVLLIVFFRLWRNNVGSGALL
jgi:hypothetical protein